MGYFTLFCDRIRHRKLNGYAPEYVTILGHRDLPGVRKECPCFNTKKWLEDIKFRI